MADFNIAIQTILRHEGGFTVDHAGATNFGVTLRTLRRQTDWDGDGYPDGDVDKDGDVDAHDVQSMTVELAKEVYRKQWWDRYGYWSISNDVIATKIFDLSVNAGPKIAHIVAQRALRACGVEVERDGMLGPITKRGITSVLPRILLVAYRAEMAGFYRTLIGRRPEFTKYKKGWLRRAYA